MTEVDKLIQLELSKEDLQLICAALDAVAPTGGGSPQFHLIGHLQTIALPIKISGRGTDPSDDAYHKVVGHLQTIAHEEYLETFELRVVSLKSEKGVEDKLSILRTNLATALTTVSELKAELALAGPISDMSRNFPLAEE